MPRSRSLTVRVLNSAVAGEFFLAQPGAGPQLPQQLPERPQRPLLPVTTAPADRFQHARSG